MEAELAALEQQCTSKQAHLERLEASLVGLEDEAARAALAFRESKARADALRWEYCERAHSQHADTRTRLEKQVHEWQDAKELDIDTVASLIFLRTHELALDAQVTRAELTSALNECVPELRREFITALVASLHVSGDMVDCAAFLNDVRARHLAVVEKARASLGS